MVSIEKISTVLLWMTKIVKLHSIWMFLIPFFFFRQYTCIEHYFFIQRDHLLYYISYEYRRIHRSGIRRRFLLNEVYARWRVFFFFFSPSENNNIAFYIILAIRVKNQIGSLDIACVINMARKQTEGAMLNGPLHYTARFTTYK